MSDLPFTCGCGAVHDAKSWAALPLLGHHCNPLDATGPEQHLELKNCPCGSTKAVEVTEHEGKCEARKT